MGFLPPRVRGPHGDGCPITQVGLPYRLASADITTTAAPLLGLSFPTDPRPLWTYRRRSSSRPASSLDVPATVFFPTRVLLGRTGDGCSILQVELPFRPASSLDVPATGVSMLQVSFLGATLAGTRAFRSQRGAGSVHSSCVRHRWLATVFDSAELYHTLSSIESYFYLLRATFRASFPLAPSCRLQQRLLTWYF